MKVIIIIIIYVHMHFTLFLIINKKEIIFLIWNDNKFFTPPILNHNFVVTGAEEEIRGVLVSHFASFFLQVLLGHDPLSQTNNKNWSGPKLNGSPNWSVQILGYEDNSQIKVDPNWIDAQFGVF